MKSFLICLFILICSPSHSEELVLHDGSKVEFIITPLSSGLALKNGVYSDDTRNAVDFYSRYLTAMSAVSSTEDVKNLRKEYVRTVNGSLVERDVAYDERMISANKARSGKSFTIKAALTFKESPDFIFIFVHPPGRPVGSLAVAGIKKIDSNYYVLDDFVDGFPTLAALQRSGLDLAKAQADINASVQRGTTNSSLNSNSAPLKK